MPETFVLSKFRKEVDDKYVGISPNSSSVKPVHISSGAFRAIFGEYKESTELKRLALVCDAKGKVHGNPLEDVYQELIDSEKLDESIDKESLESLRNVIQKLISADKAVYVVDRLDGNMISYTAGSKHFITKKSIFEDAGELIAEIIKEQCPSLTQTIKDTLADSTDPITILFDPVIARDDEDVKQAEYLDIHEIDAFNRENENMAYFKESIKELL